MLSFEDQKSMIVGCKWNPSMQYALNTHRARIYNRTLSNTWNKLRYSTMNLRNMHSRYHQNDTSQEEANSSIPHDLKSKLFEILDFSLENAILHSI